MLRIVIFVLWRNDQAGDGSTVSFRLVKTPRALQFAAPQSLGISDDTKERLNRLVIKVATTAADSFIKRGSRLSSPADLYRSRFCSSFRTSAIWIWVKENLERLGRVGGRSCWPRLE